MMLPSCTDPRNALPCINHVSVNIENYNSVWYTEDNQANEGPKIKSAIARVPSVLYHGHVVGRPNIKNVLSDKAGSVVSPMSMYEALLKYSFVIQRNDGNNSGQHCTYGAYVDRKGYARDYLLPDKTLIISMDYAEHHVKGTDTVEVYSPMDEYGVKVVSHFDMKTQTFIPGSVKYNGIQLSRAASHGLRLVLFELDDEGIIVTNRKKDFPIMDPSCGRPFLVTKLAKAGHYRLGPPFVSFLVRFLENNVIRSVPVGTTSCSPTDAVASIIAKVAGVDSSSLDCARISDAIANACNNIGNIGNIGGKYGYMTHAQGDTEKQDDKQLNNDQRNETTLLNIHVRFSVPRSAKVTCVYEILSLYVALTWA